MKPKDLPVELTNIGIPFDKVQPPPKSNSVHICESCGNPMKKKTIFKGRRFHRRKFESFECIDCGFAEYKYNDREDLILKGSFDNEL